MSLIENIKSFFEMLHSEVFKVNNQMKEIEKRLNWRINKLKRSFKHTFLYLMFVLLTVGFLSAGLIIFLNRFFPLDVILLVFGGMFAVCAVIFNILE